MLHLNDELLSRSKTILDQNYTIFGEVIDNIKTGDLALMDRDDMTTKQGKTTIRVAYDCLNLFYCVRYLRMRMH